jgi:hypothetical protein
MPLDAKKLETQLIRAWSGGPGGTFPSTPQAAADRFADAVAAWFSDAVAGGAKCTTAQSRKPLLSNALLSSLKSGKAATAGQGLAAALAMYLTGQVFGTGLSQVPFGTSAAGVAFSAAFAEINAPLRSRAQRFTLVCQGLVATTLVIIPPSPNPVPIL